MCYKVMDLEIIHPSDCPVLTQLRAERADWSWHYALGYIRYNDRGLNPAYEHQLVADLAYGVPTGFHVHHIDENKLNNAASNLAVLSAAEHARLHAVDRVDVLCAYCGAPLQVTEARLRRRKNMYCDRDCANLGNRKVLRPTPQYLAELIATLNNWSELGRMFGVTDNAVRKWARAYELL